MILGSILSNMSSGISGAAAKGKELTSSVDLRQLIGGKHEYNRSVDLKYQKAKEEGEKFTKLRAFTEKSIGNQLASDYKGEGWTRAGVVGIRQGAGLATSVPIEAGLRYATGSGTLTEKDGKKDIAGIPFV